MAVRRISVGSDEVSVGTGFQSAMLLNSRADEILARDRINSEVTYQSAYFVPSSAVPRDFE
jgi:hypothetical protein